MSSFTLFTDRYRNFGNLTITHLVIIISLITLTFLLYSLVIRRRSYHVRKARRDVLKNPRMLDRKTMPRRFYGLMIGEIIREKRIRDNIIPQDAGQGDLCWDDEGVHFSTSIAKSYIVLDQHASVVRPGMRHWHFRTVREYLVELKKVFPSIEQEHINLYLDRYERATFDHHRFHKDAYLEFMHNVVHILDHIY